MKTRKEIISGLIETIDTGRLFDIFETLDIWWEHPNLPDYRAEEQTLKLKIAELAEQALTQCQSVEWGCLQIIYNNGDVKFNFVYPFKK
jgi:hypothetical protein